MENRKFVDFTPEHWERFKQFAISEERVTRAPLKFRGFPTFHPHDREAFILFLAAMDLFFQEYNRDGKIPVFCFHHDDDNNSDPETDDVT